MKSSDSIQLEKDTGTITITGPVKAVFIETLRNGDALFVKAGTNSSTAKYLFNEGCLFRCPDGTKYVQIRAESRVINFEFFDLIY